MSIVFKVLWESWGLPEMRSSGGGQVVVGAEGLPLPGLITNGMVSASKIKEALSSIRLTFLVLLRRLIYDRAVFQAPEIKHAHTSISATANEHVNAVGAETHVVHFLVVCNELRLCRQCGYIPDCASCVDAGSDNQAGRYRIPVQGCNRSGMLGRFRIGKQRQRREFSCRHISLT